MQKFEADLKIAFKINKFIKLIIVKNNPINNYQYYNNTNKRNSLSRENKNLIDRFIHY